MRAKVTVEFGFGVSPFYFFCHREPHESNYGTIQDSTEPELSQGALEWAETAARRLAGVRLGVIYSSPRKRALASASIIADLNDVPVHHLGDLRDRQWSAHRLYGSAQSGVFPKHEHLEPIDAFASRVISALHSMTGPWPVLVIAHSGVFRVLDHYGRLRRARIGDTGSAQLFHLQPPVSLDSGWKVTEVPI